MPLSKRAQLRYRQALGAFGAHPVQVELDVDTLALLIAAVQLALSQPACPAASRGFLARWVEATLTALGTLSVDLSAGLRAGSDPAAGA